jgi:dihydrofolate reductase
MRKLIVSMNVTLDGFMSGPDSELDWHFNAWNEEMARMAAEQLSRTDTIILGRITYRAMARYWPMQAVNLLCAREDIVFADMMNTHTKIVFSKTLQSAEWNNTKLVKRNIAKEILNLKRQPGKDMIIYGSGKIVAALIQHDLVDEYQVWVHPVVLGKGKPLFPKLQQSINVALSNTKIFSSGVVMLSYVTQHG